MSLSDSMKYVVRKASVSGTFTTQKIYAVYGARSVETGPIQLLKSKLLRYLRPFNPGSFAPFASVRHAITVPT
jgi:hypothetical protein